MTRNQFGQSKINAFTSLAHQLVTIVSGMILPRILIGTFGSSEYGATTSVLQFLSFITLADGGIGVVARTAFYEPLANGDSRRLGVIYYAIKRFYAVIGMLFIAYVFLLASNYHRIADISFWDYKYGFCMVVVLSVSTMAQYFWGMCPLTLLNADQKHYINNIFSIFTTLINAITVILLTHRGYDLLTIKLTSSLIFIIRPSVFAWYVKRNYVLGKPTKVSLACLHNRWEGLGQHIAYYLHNNTDIVWLTTCSNLTNVAIYSVYSMVIVSLRNITRAMVADMEAVFGRLLVNQSTKINNAYVYYENLLSTIATILMVTAGIMITSFVSLYTKGISDAVYYQPAFSLILIIAELINLVMLPCYTIPLSANHFRQIRIGAYGEAIVNILFSGILVWWNPLCGVAIGTLLAAVFKSCFYMYYVSRHLLPRKMCRMFSRLIIILVCFGTMIPIGRYCVGLLNIDSIIRWIICATVVFIVSCILTVGIHMIVEGKKYVLFLHALLGGIDAF